MEKTILESVVLKNNAKDILPKSFCNYLYEYKKGVKSLVLYTASLKYLKIIEQKLNLNNLSYLVFHLSNTYVNVFFGDKTCIDVLKSFRKNSLSDLNLEEEFILGSMLGYSMQEQTKRYLSRRSKLVG